jgi:hypothetical protein
MADSEETASFDERRLATVGFKAGVEMTLTARRGGEGGTFKGRVGPLSLIEDKGGTTGHAASASPESRGKVEPSSLKVLRFCFFLEVEASSGHPGAEGTISSLNLALP